MNITFKQLSLACLCVMMVINLILSFQPDKQKAEHCETRAAIYTCALLLINNL